VSAPPRLRAHRADQAVPYASASYGRTHETVRRRGAARGAPCAQRAENAYRSSSAGAGAFAGSDGMAARGNAGRRTGAGGPTPPLPRRIPKWPTSGEISRSEEEPPGGRASCCRRFRVSACRGHRGARRPRAGRARRRAAAHAADCGAKSRAAAIRCRFVPKRQGPARSTRSFSRPWGRDGAVLPLTWPHRSATRRRSPAASRAMPTRFAGCPHPPQRPSQSPRLFPWCMRRRLARIPASKPSSTKSWRCSALMPGRAQCCPLRVWLRSQCV